MLEHIRNFSIVAHIDHGKSTLADRLLEFTGTIDKKELRKRAQILDSMDLEQEHGVTIKAHPVRMTYKARDGNTYILNLIDTPGHVDFGYEVSRSLEATEGVILLIDGQQGIEAQTLAHFQLARSLDKTVIPVINKIDLPTCRVEQVANQIREVLHIMKTPILVSAKEGIGVDRILEEIVREIPCPQGDINKPLRALIFDSLFDQYKGVVVYVRVVDGEIVNGLEIQFMSNKRVYEVTDIGVFLPKLRSVKKLRAGEVGYIIAGIKDIQDIHIGDTITGSKNPSSVPLPGYKEVKPMVFCSFYPTNDTNFKALSLAMSRLRLNDSSWVYTEESSSGLGLGFRCGFLGLFHMHIIQERLEREYEIDVIATTPFVPYRITKRDGEVIEIENPTNFPINPLKTEEPYIKARIFTPDEYIGQVLRLLESRRGRQISFDYIDCNRVILTYEIPLSEIVNDFYDRLKGVSSGYASFDYEYIGFRDADLVKLDILIAGEVIDPLSTILPREKAYFRACELVRKLKDVIPRQQFAVSLQGAIGKRVIARETIPALRKNVTAKCYGGDITRKRKLWEKQKKGKQRLKKVGNITLPQEAFQAILKIE
ncbi:MAG: translation elongation factor 4 [bacterium]|nr:translation elongation factor 4 [bacterium]